jgi:hypothetical protein
MLGKLSQEMYVEGGGWKREEEEEGRRRCGKRRAEEGSRREEGAPKTSTEIFFRSPGGFRGFRDAWEIVARDVRKGEGGRKEEEEGGRFQNQYGDLFPVSRASVVSGMLGKASQEM